MRNSTAAIITHRFQDGHLMANFRYNPEKECLEKLAADSPIREKTKFMVMKEGRLVFEGSEAELDACSDPDISKFSMHPARKSLVNTPICHPLANSLGRNFESG
jgi:phospholipid/cholesterol/gamma-HCH transport system ATP-binding protein